MRVNGQRLGKSLDEDDASAMELVAGSGLDAGDDDPQLGGEGVEGAGEIRDLVAFLASLDG